MFWVKRYEPNGGQPDGYQHGNDDPNENPKLGTHAMRVMRSDFNVLYA
jgi:hypothetical protein